MFKEVKNRIPGVCPAYRCKNEVSDHKKYGHRHHAQSQKGNNPVGYHYNLLKQNAKRRGKDFGITMGEFRTLCEETGYLDKKGKSKNSASLDRIDPEKGYYYENLQVISLSDNSKKRWTDTEGDDPF